MRHYVNKKWEMGNRKPMPMYAYLLKIGGHIPFCALSRWVEMQKAYTHPWVPGMTNTKCVFLFLGLVFLTEPLRSVSCET